MENQADEFRSLGHRTSAAPGARQRSITYEFGPGVFRPLRPDGPWAPLGIARPSIPSLRRSRALAAAVSHRCRQKGEAEAIQSNHAELLQYLEPCLRPPGIAHTATLNLMGFSNRSEMVLQLKCQGQVRLMNSKVLATEPYQHREPGNDQLLANLGLAYSGPCGLMGLGSLGIARPTTPSLRRFRALAAAVSHQC